MSKLTDRSGLSPSWYCHNCSIEVDPSLTELRSASKLSVPDGPIEHPSVAFPPEPGLVRKKTEVKGGLAELAKRSSIRIKSYLESNTKR